MSNTFGFSQGDDGTTRIARVIVPDCGRNERDDAPIILIEKDHKTGEITLMVYADVQSTEPTHVIDLAGAKLSNRRRPPNPLS